MTTRQPASPLVTALTLALREVADRKARERTERRAKLTVLPGKRRRNAA